MKWAPGNTPTKLMLFAAAWARNFYVNLRVPPTDAGRHLGLTQKFPAAALGCTHPTIKAIQKYGITHHAPRDNGWEY